MGAFTSLPGRTTSGEAFALNKGLQFVETELLITLDADTLLQKSAVRYLIARYLTAPVDVCAVAGTVLVRKQPGHVPHPHAGMGLFFAIVSIKRLQGLYQSTLVAQGAFSLYKKEAVRAIGGWPDAIGEDIVLTWRFFKSSWRVYFEPLAVAFTVVLSSFRHFARQRSRWARGMIEALKEIKPWYHPNMFAKFLTDLDLLVPFLDAVYTFAWIPGLLLALTGFFWIVGPYALFVLPLTLLSYSILYRFQKMYSVP
ncbi:hypothetical protein skT53_15980 [Effusibacillus dendaii]|uniref:Glycosyltransferase 2-like domain-containing protein n=1 Tax=Effusibacillus dendaii TaxID=2743772 RepID=A0A7I8D8Z1_9BACL|nr:glycosyltransferase family 2 protein [Effusibacillus dendaii]BCJ86613.1 hypothetical protein skT53_15980 [Effusibacillus dendaii]